MTTTNDAGTTPDSTVQDAGSTGDQPDYKALYQQALADQSEWKNRFNGLQGTYQREQQKWKETQAAADQLKAALDTVTTEKSSLVSQLEEVQNKVGEAETEKDVTLANLERMQIVVTEFPQLTPFLAKGLIPDETGEELRVKLRELSLTIDGIKTGALDQYKSGASPKEPPRGKQESSADDMRAELAEAFRTGDSTKYNQIYDKILGAKPT